MATAVMALGMGGRSRSMRKWGGVVIMMAVAVGNADAVGAGSRRGWARTCRVGSGRLGVMIGLVVMLLLLMLLVMTTVLVMVSVGTG